MFAVTRFMLLDPRSKEGEDVREGTKRPGKHKEARVIVKCDFRDVNGTLYR